MDAVVQRLTPLQASFVDHIVKAEVPNLSPEVLIVPKRFDDCEGLELQHSVTIAQQKLNLVYHVKFKEVSAPTTPYIPSLTEVNEVVIPISFAETSMNNSVRAAWRRVTIADPRLYATYAAEQVAIRDYQNEAAQASMESIRKGGNPLLVMFTASGKTLTAFHIMDIYMKETSLLNDPNSKVIFLINNTTILSEAERSLNKFRSNYSTSQCYEGHRDISGQVIFATPASLSGEALREVLATNRVAMVISDETHHLPANLLSGIYNSIKESSSNQGFHTPFVGLTATPIRPDQASVIRYFDHNVTFRYGYQRAFQEGYVPRIIHRACDLDMSSHTGDFSKVPILPGSPQYALHLQERYDSRRFDHFLISYQKNVEGRPDKRMLFIGPNTDFSLDVAAHFNTNQVPAMRLSSIEKVALGTELFRRSYEAWKHSDGSNRSVPAVVTSVDMFKEGIDVPGVGVIGLCEDSNSSIVVTQSIGRGARPAPGKVSTVILDFVGLYRKLSFLQFLGNLSPQREEGAGGGRAESRDREVDFDALRISQEGDLLGMDTEVSETLSVFLNDVPTTMVNLYGRYENVPWNERKQLDRFIHEQLVEAGEISESDDLSFCLKEVSESIQKGERTYRHYLVSIFSYAEENLSPNGKEIQYSANTKILFDRLSDLLLTVNPALEKDKIYKILSEFDPSRDAVIKNIGQNLHFFRDQVFQLSKRAMTDLLIDEVLDAKLINAESHPLSFGYLGMDRTGVKDDPQTIDFAEDTRGKYSTSSKLSSVATHSEFKYAMIEAYLAHPKIKGKIQAADFELPASEFRQILVEKSLITGTALSPALVIKAFQSFAKMYVDSSQASNAELLEAGERFLDFISQSLNCRQIKLDENTGQMIVSRSLQAFEEAAAEVRKINSDQFDAEISKLHQKILQEITNWEESTGSAYAVKDQELGLSLVLRRDSKLSAARITGQVYEIEVEVPGQQITDPHKLRVAIRLGVLNQALLYVEKDHIDPSKLSSWEKVFDELPDHLRAAYIDLTWQCCEKLMSQLDLPCLSVLPDSSDEYLACKALCDHVRDNTEAAFLGPLRNTTLYNQSSRFTGNLQSLKFSRLPYSPTELSQIFKDVKLGGISSVPTQITFISIYRDKIEPVVKQILQKLEVSSELKDLDVAKYIRAKCEALLRVSSLEPKWTRPLISIEERSSMLGIDQPDKPFSIERISELALSFATITDSESLVFDSDNLLPKYIQPDWSVQKLFNILNREWCSNYYGSDDLPEYSLEFCRAVSSAIGVLIRTGKANLEDPGIQPLIDLVNKFVK